MATVSVNNTSVCCICYETFKIPKILTCGHTFCLDCIKRLIGDNKIGETFRCPTCKQDVKIPTGGAEEFITNYIVTNQPPKCPNHKRTEVNYYCNNCNVGLCFRCISIKEHKEHETLDIVCDETRNEAIKKLQRSQYIIQNRIKKLEETRSTLLESFEQLKSLCEDSIAKAIEKTEKIVSDLRKGCENMIEGIRKNLEETTINVEEKEKEITSDINDLESIMESNISPKTTFHVLQTLHRLKEIETLGESGKDYNMCIQYLQWVGNDFSLDIDQLWSVISEPFYIPGSYQFLFNVSDIEKDNYYNSKNKFRYNNLVWSCSVMKVDGFLNVGMIILNEGNPRLHYCIFDGQISLLNIDDSKTLTIRDSRELKVGPFWYQSITWSKLTNKNNGYLNSNDQFVVRIDIKQIREILDK